MPESSSRSVAAPPVAYVAPAPAPTAPRAVVASHRRLPGLDGLRAISISLVIAWHVADLHVVRGLEQMWRVDAGNLGVRTFFVISGFLITTLLLAELDRTGTIGLRQFYMRRTFRIMPAFYAFLAAMALAAAAGWQVLSMRSVVHAATFTSNYFITQWPVGHTWSLSVEEQFYLLWPGLLLLVGRRWGFRVALAMLLVSPALRAAAVLSGAAWPVNPRYAFGTVADALAVGCLMARQRDALWQWAPYRRVVGSRLAVLVPIAMLVVAAAGVRWPLFGAAVGVSLLNLLIAVGIDWAVRSPRTLVGRLLDARPIAFVGTLSYSLYLWQQPFLSEKLTLPLPLRLAGLVSCALASYYLIEKPALRWRHRFERR